MKLLEGVAPDPGTVLVFSAFRGEPINVRVHGKSPATHTVVRVSASELAGSLQDPGSCRAQAHGCPSSDAQAPTEGRAPCQEGDAGSISSVCPGALPAPEL